MANGRLWTNEEIEILKDCYNKAIPIKDIAKKLNRTKGGVGYDPFNGTGTTGVACKRLGMSYFGSEISKAQVEYSINRINNTEV